MVVNIVKKILEWSLGRKFGLFCKKKPEISKDYAGRLDCGTVKCKEQKECVDNLIVIPGCSLNVSISIIDNSLCTLNITSISLVSDVECNLEITSVDLKELIENCNFEIDNLTVTDNTVCDLEIKIIELITPNFNV